MTDLFVGLGSSCQTFQQACTQLQMLLQSRKEAGWAAGPWNGITPVDGVSRQASPASILWADKITIPQRTTTKSVSCTPPSAYFASVHGTPFASLVASSGVSVGSEAAEHRICCTGAARGASPLQTHLEQTLAPLAEGQPRPGRQQDGNNDEDSIRRLVPNLSGTWIKNRERSDSMDHAMDLVRLNGIVRQAVKLVRGVRVEMDPHNFTFTVFSIISWFKVKEVYPWSGEERHFRRRDLRRGGALGRLAPLGQDLAVHVRWNDPLGGHGRDHFRLVSEDELHIESVINVGDKTARYTTVYNRKPDRRRRRDGANGPADPHQAASTELGEEGAGSELGGGRHAGGQEGDGAGGAGRGHGRQ